MVRPSAQSLRLPAGRETAELGEAMFIVVIMLGGAGLVVFLAGCAWGLIERGQTRRARGPEIGAEMMAEKMGSDAATSGKTPLAQKTAFVGTGWAVEREAEYSWSEIRTALQAGNIRAVVPALLAGAGMLMFMFCLALALLIRLHNKIYGGIVLGIALYALYITVKGLCSAPAEPRR